MSKMHLVFGGRVSDPQTTDFDLSTIHMVGIFPDYASALDAWRSNAQRTVDDAEMKYVVVHLHRLFEPTMEKPVIDNLVTEALSKLSGHATAIDLCETLVAQGLSRKDSQLAIQRAIDAAEIFTRPNWSLSLTPGDIAAAA